MGSEKKKKKNLSAAVAVYKLAVASCFCPSCTLIASPPFFSTMDVDCSSHIPIKWQWFMLELFGTGKAWLSNDSFSAPYKGNCTLALLSGVICSKSVVFQEGHCWICRRSHWSFSSSPQSTTLVVHYFGGRKAQCRTPAVLMRCYFNSHFFWLDG